MLAIRYVVGAVLAVSSLTLTSAQVLADSPELKPHWQTDGLRTPESVLYVPDENGPYLLVSEIEGEGNQADGKGGIAKLSLEGEILDQDWSRGMNAPKGMGLRGDTLYVADLTEVLMVDLEGGRVQARIPVDDSVFLNDIAVADDGTVYVSDTRTGKVHRIHNKDAELFLEDLKDPNGLYTEGNDLYIGAGDTLLKASPEGELETVATGFESGIDGVEKIADGEFLVTCWVGLVYHVDNGEVTRLMDTREPRMNTADLGWNPEDGIAYIPTFFNDSVRAYRWQ